jgi:hypothetical protein
MDSTTKPGHPKGSKDGPRRPGAPPHGRPKISAEQSESEGEQAKNAFIFCYGILSLELDTILLHCSSISYIQELT